MGAFETRRTERGSGLHEGKPEKGTLGCFEHNSKLFLYVSSKLLNFFIVAGNIIFDFSTFLLDNIMILNYELFFRPSELFLLSLKRLGMLKILLCLVSDYPFGAGRNADVGSKAF